MYREEPDDDIDSGWRFFAGDESEEYCQQPENFARYDVNTIANYSPDIVPFLSSEPGRSFARASNGQLVEEPFDPPKD
jgi:hypothetical protein